MKEKNIDYFKADKKSIEYKINVYTLNSFWIVFFTLIVILVLNALNIFIVNKELMTRGCLCSFIIAVFTLIMGKFMDLHKSYVKYVLLFNIILAITVLGVMITYHTVLLSVMPLVLAIQYADNKVTLYTYLLTILSVSTIVMGGYFFGLCDANMLALTTEPAAYYMDKATNTLTFELKNTNPWYTLPMYYILPRCMILFAILPIIKSISRNIVAYTENAVKMRLLSETDSMTGLYNKNKYLQMVKDTYPSIEKVGVMFFDVNNLKLVNDTLGHEKGDMVITYAANLISRLQKENRKAYRLGGDEFALIIENLAPDEEEQIRKLWDEFMMAKLVVSKYQVMIAVGYAEGPGNNIDEIIRKSDKNMYLNKEKLKDLVK